MRQRPWLPWPRVTAWDLATDPDFRSFSDQDRRQWLTVLCGGSQAFANFSDEMKVFWLSVMLAPLPTLSRRQRFWRALRVIAARLWYRDTYSARRTREDLDGLRDLVLLVLRLFENGTSPHHAVPPPGFILDGPTPERNSEVN